MNKLLFILPSDHSLKDSALAFCRELTAFLDHENYEAYWNEAAYKALRGEIDREDRVSQGYMRLKSQGFTDYKYLPAPPADLTVMADGTDCTATVYGRFAAHRLLEQAGNNGKIALVKTSSEALPALLNIWHNGRQGQPQYTTPIITDCSSANNWFAVNRKPPRHFNTEYRHGVKEYQRAGKNVSPLNISTEQREYALRHAVGCKATTRLMHHYAELGLYIVFSYENRLNGDAPVYHGHQFPDTDKGEFNRLPGKLTGKLKKI